jgi:hypothetical protein
VQRPPLVIGSVCSLRPVGDRVVHVELHVAVAGVVLLEGRDDEPRGVAPFPRRLGVVRRADVSELPLRHGDHPVIGPLHCPADLRGPLCEPLSVRFAPLRLRFSRSSQKRSPEHGHALGRRERVVIERDKRPVGAAEPEPERPLLLRRPEPAPLGLLPGHLRLDPLVHRVPARNRIGRYLIPPQDLRRPRECCWGW